MANGLEYIIISLTDKYMYMYNIYSIIVSITLQITNNKLSYKGVIYMFIVHKSLFQLCNQTCICVLLHYWGEPERAPHR